MATDIWRDHLDVLFFCVCFQGGYGGGRSSQSVYDDGYVPEYHTGRRYSQDQVRDLRTTSPDASTICKRL